jgi:hypothetical protein
MCSAGLGTNIDCADKGQQQFSSEWIAKRCNIHGTYVRRKISSVVEEKAPFLNKCIATTEHNPWS